MKTLYESILDDQDVLIGNANGEAENTHKKMQIAKDFIINTFGENYRINDPTSVRAPKNAISLIYEPTHDAVSYAAFRKKIEPFKKEMSKLNGKFEYKTVQYLVKYTSVLFTDDDGDQIDIKHVELYKIRKTSSYISILLYGKYAHLFK